MEEEFVNEDVNEIEQCFGLYGGIPRFIFSDEPYSKKVKDLTDVINNCKVSDSSSACETNPGCDWQ